MRVRSFLLISFRDIRRQPVRSALTIVALVISSCLFVALAALGLQTRSAINDQIGQNTSANSIVVTSSKTVSNGLFGGNVQLAAESGGKLDDETVSTLSTLPDVESATPLVSVWQFKEFSIEGYDQVFLAKTNAVEPNATGLFSLGAGRRFAAGDSGAQVILGSGYAQALGAAEDPAVLVGKVVRIQTQNAYRGQGATVPAPRASNAELDRFALTPTYLSATVVGVTGAASKDSLIYIPMAWAHAVQSPQSWTASGITTKDSLAKNGYTSIIVQLTRSEAVRPVSAAIDALGYGTTSREQEIDQVNQLSVVMWIVLGSISLISMISASLGIVNTMLMTVSEQRYAIGVWRACGATRSLITRLFLLQAFILGLLGGVLGTVLGTWVSGYVNRKIAVLLQAQGLSAFTIHPVSATSLVAAVVVTTLLAIVAGIYPAHRAARNIEV